jgi:glycosyltransferase involved in cell wall biosynthesis
VDIIGEGLLLLGQIMEMSATPEISVIMSVYNGAEHLNESVESILSQEGVDFEFIIIDDGSTDESGRILDEYAKKDNRVRIIHQENIGLTKALIRGCAEAQGIYIARQDVGDVSLPGRLALQKAALGADDTLSFVSCWTEVVGPEYEFLYLTKGTGCAKNPLHIISEKAKFGVADGPASHGSVMLRRSAYARVGGYREYFYFGQDWDLWYRLAQLGKFQMVSQPLYRAKLTPGSISASYKKMQDAIAKLSLAALQRRLSGASEEDIVREASTLRPVKDSKDKSRTRAAWLYFIGACLRKQGNPKAASYFRQAFRTFPLHLKSAVRLMFGK